MQDFIPNYGVWLDEVEPYGMTHLMKKKWPRATVYLGGGDNEKKILARPYGQVREKLRTQALKETGKLQGDLTGRERPC